MDLSDRVAVMRAGRLQQVAPPRVLYDRPANAFVAGFVGESSLLGGVVVAVEGERAVLRTAGGRRLEALAASVRAGDRVLVLLRPDAATVGEAGDAAAEGLVGTVEDVSDPGPVERGRVRLDGGERVTVTRPRRAGVAGLLRGTRLALRWPPEEVRLLPPEP
jgi:ABC-type Fe3+/spermidine/putrescine transport system ATPase subunit